MPGQLYLVAENHLLTSLFAIRAFAEDAIRLGLRPLQHNINGKQS